MWGRRTRRRGSQCDFEFKLKKGSIVGNRST